MCSTFNPNLKIWRPRTGGIGWGNRVGDREKQNALQNRIRKKASGLSKVTKDNFIYFFFILMKIFTWNTFM